MTYVSVSYKKQRSCLLYAKIVSASGARVIALASVRMSVILKSKLLNAGCDNTDCTRGLAVNSSAFVLFFIYQPDFPKAAGNCRKFSRDRKKKIPEISMW
jgi:hypothetical protein